MGNPTSLLFGAIIWAMILYGVYSMHRRVRQRNTPPEDPPAGGSVHFALPPFHAGTGPYRLVFTPDGDRLERIGVRVCDNTGRPLRTLVESGPHGGPLDIVWDGRDSRGRMVDPGVYLLLVEMKGVTHVSVLVRA